MRYAAILFLALLLASPTTVAVAGPIEDAAAAFEREDWPAALKTLQSLAEQRNAEAQNALGWMYTPGKGVPKDDAEAAKWYSLAAQQGDSDSQFHLALMYNEGRGVKKDYTEAFFGIAPPGCRTVFNSTSLHETTPSTAPRILNGSRND